MSSEKNTYFTKDNLDVYLKELGKEFRRVNGNKMPAEITLIGGASIIINYGFRDMTYDVDAIIHASSTMKEAINHVGDKYDLPNGWLNSDFIRSSSYTHKLDEFSTYYKTFSNVLQVRTISAEYLIAMKLCAGRKYKSDLSDILGILNEHDKNGNPISFESVEKAVFDLYDSWDNLPSESYSFIQGALTDKNYLTMFNDKLNEETKVKEDLIEFINNNNENITETNIDEVLNQLQKRKKS